jgi:hypothetical protein
VDRPSGRERCCQEIVRLSERRRSDLHLILTDLLTCARCGSGQGLIVLSQRMEERRVLEGALGCPMCETKFAVRNGLADVRADGTSAAWESGATNVDALDAFRIAALLGITEGAGFVLLLGATQELAMAITQITPQVELIVAGPALDEAAEQRGINRVRIGNEVPVRDGSMRGIAALTDVSRADVAMLSRKLGYGARLIAPAALSNEDLEVAGLRVLARDETLVVVVRAP